jgi:hypothetical protein
LTSNQSIFDKDTFGETISILKEALDNIDKNTYYKDADYWGLYEAIEIFLYGEINPDQNDGDYWGIKGFSLVWEDMCSTYFFKKYPDKICYADTDIPLKDPPHPEPKRQGEEPKRVGNHRANHGNNGYGNKWIYRQNLIFAILIKTISLDGMNSFVLSLILKLEGWYTQTERMMN